MQYASSSSAPPYNWCLTCGVAQRAACVGRWSQRHAAARNARRCAHTWAVVRHPAVRHSRSAAYSRGCAYPLATGNIRWRHVSSVRPRLVPSRHDPGQCEDALGVVSGTAWDSARLRWGAVWSALDGARLCRGADGGLGQRTTALGGHRWLTVDISNDISASAAAKAAAVAIMTASCQQ